jgi:hypothetical protein
MIPEVRACSTLSVAIGCYRTIGQIARTPGPCPQSRRPSATPPEGDGDEQSHAPRPVGGRCRQTLGYRIHTTVQVKAPYRCQDFMYVLSPSTGGPA